MPVRTRMSSKRRMPLKTSRSTTTVHFSPRTSIARPIVHPSIDQLSASGDAVAFMTARLGLLDRRSKRTKPESMTQTQERTRTFGWTDPAAHAAEIGRQSGLDFLQAMARGDFPAPPIMQLI